MSSKTQYLAYAEIMFDENTSVENKIARANDSAIRSIVEVDLNYLDQLKQGTKFLEVCP